MILNKHVCNTQLFFCNQQPHSHAQLFFFLEFMFSANKYFHDDAESENVSRESGSGGEKIFN